MNIGLVLSGGMAKGAYQIGALKALQAFIPTDEIKYVSCASIGVLNGYAFRTNKLDAAEQMWKDVCCNDSRLFISQILRSSLLQQDIKNIFSMEDEIDSDFYISLLDMTHESIVYKNLVNVKKDMITRYLKASVAMPLFNKAVNIGNIAYYDGAMVDNIPVYPLIKHSLDYIICIHFDEHIYKFEDSHFNHKVIQLTFPSDTVLRQSLVFDQNNIENMITKGYNHTRYLLNAMIGRDYQDLEYIYHSIEYRNAQIKDSKVRITGDMIVTNINKVTQKLARRKIVV